MRINPPETVTKSEEHKREILGFFYGFLAALSTSIIAVFIKFASNIPSETMVFARFVIGLPFLLVFFFNGSVKFSFQEIPKHLIRGLAGLASLYCFFYSIKELPLVNAVTLSNTQPLFMPLLVLVWLRLVVSKFRYIAVSIGFAGVVILLHPTENILEWASLVGLLGGLLSAVAMVGVRLLSKEESTQAILCYYFLISTVVSFFPMVFAWEPISSWKDWLYLFLIGAISGFYQYFLTLSYSYAPSSKASILSYSGVIFGGLAGWWFFGEDPHVWVILGAALILLSAVMALFDKTPARPI